MMVSSSSVEEGDNDEMASLFEGMILFDPSSQIKTTTPPPPPPPAPADDHPTSTTDDFSKQQHLSLHLPTALEVESSSSTTTSTSQPLDENLFSDLTLVTTDSFELPPPQSDSSCPSHRPPPPPPLYASTSVTAADVTEVAPHLSSSLVSRQFSTRKKKRAGLRIGYGRDSQIHDLPDSSQSPPPQPQQQQLPPSTPLPSPVPPLLSKVRKDEQNEASSSSPSFISPGFNGKLDSTVTMTARTTGRVAAVGDNTSLDDTISAMTGDPSPTSTCDPITVNAPVTNGEPSHESSSMDILEEDDLIIQGQTNNTTTSSSISNSPIELGFDHIKFQISEKLNHVREIVASLSSTRKDSIRRRRKAAEDLSLASTKHKEMEKELEEACEAEDFETAETVSDSLASAEKKKELLSTALREAEADCDAVDSKMQEALASQIAAEVECATLLESFAMDAAHEADLVITSAELVISKEMDKWFSSTEALEVKKIELEIESHLISEVRLELNDSIECSIRDDRGEREILLKKKEMLTEDLEKLLALVRQKEAEIAENDSNIEKAEKKITDAVSSCQKLQSSIHSKFNNLQSCLSQIELDFEALSRKKKEIDDFFSKEEGRVSKIRELARISADEASVCREVVDLRKSLVQFISKSQEDKVRLAKTGEELSVDLQMLKQDISAERASLQDLSCAKSRVQQVIESYKQRLLFIDKRIPELEAEKKIAATARNFKEAARIATEAKALYVEKEHVQIKTEEAVLELKKLEVDISRTVNSIEELEEQILSKEKELAAARYQRLLLVAAAAMAERSAALELGDLEEADILLGEALAADAEAKKLQPIYNLKEEEFENVSKHLFISMDLISSLGRNQLAELTAYANLNAL